MTSANFRVKVKVKIIITVKVKVNIIVTVLVSSKGTYGTYLQIGETCPVLTLVRFHWHEKVP